MSGTRTYAIDLSAGDVRMKNSLVVAVLVGVVVASLALIDTPVVRGTDINPIDGLVKGVWRIVDSPFYVKVNPSGKLEVPPGEILTIEAGVTVYFEAPYNLIVKGKLVAGGTRDLRITFAWRDGGTDRDKWGGITLHSTSGSSTITYCNIANARRAISAYGSSNNILTFNVIRYSVAGILVSAAEGNTITDNEIYDCSDSGIALCQGSQRNEISRNTIYKIGPTIAPFIRGDGIVFNGTSGGPMNIDNKIKDNTIYNCHLSAIRLDHVQTMEISGNVLHANCQRATNRTASTIYLRKSNDTNLDYENKDIVINNNRIHSAAGNGTGIYMQSVRNVRVTYNDIYLNNNIGIIVGFRLGNVTTLGQISRNNLRNNGFCQAWDNGTSMVWDDGSKGNYWSDYNGTGYFDANNDGIGDVPYVVLGPKHSKDFFPLVSPLLFIVTTFSTVTTISASSTVYRFTITNTIPTYTFTTILVPLTNYNRTINMTTTVSTYTSISTTSYSMAFTTFYATSTSYVWTVSVSTTATFYSTTYTSTTATTTTTSTSTSTTGTTATVTTTATETATPRRCVIASAAYGSELSPAVQFLRDFRDHEVVGTFAGAEFIKVFNAFYYSFSPTLAESISENDNAKVLTRALITPLVAILQTGEALTWGLMPQSELKVIVAGLISSSLIGLFYSSPMIALSVAKVNEERKRRGTPLNYLALVWICSLVAVGMAYVLIYLGQTGAASFVMMVSTGTLVLSTMILSPLLLLKLIRRLLH
jgi:peptide/nickel transport system substrate-binding protein